MSEGTGTVRTWALAQLGAHQRLAAAVLGIAAVPSLAIVAAAGRPGIWVAIMLAVAAAVVWLMAVGFDRRYPSATIGNASLRTLPVLGAIALALLLFADGWTFGGSTEGRLAFAALMAAGLASAIWFGRSGEPAATPMVAAGSQRRLHVIVAVLAAAVVVPLSFLLAALVAYCSTAGNFYWLFAAGLAVAAGPIGAGLWLDQRDVGGAGLAAAIGRIGLALIATTVVAVLVLSLAPLATVECN